MGNSKTGRNRQDDQLCPVVKQKNRIGEENHASGAVLAGDIREQASALGQEPKLRIATRARSSILGVKWIRGHCSNQSKA
jgi:hypothetical protein